METVSRTHAFIVASINIIFLTVLHLCRPYIIMHLVCSSDYAFIVVVMQINKLAGPHWRHTTILWFRLTQECALNFQQYSFHDPRQCFLSFLGDLRSIYLFSWKLYIEVDTMSFILFELSQEHLISSMAMASSVPPNVTGVSGNLLILAWGSSFVLYSLLFSVFLCLVQ